MRRGNRERAPVYNRTAIEMVLGKPDVRGLLCILEFLKKSKIGKSENGY